MAFSLKELEFSLVIMVLSSYHMFNYCYAVYSYFMGNRLVPWLHCKCLEVRVRDLCSLCYVLLPHILLLCLGFQVKASQLVNCLSMSKFWKIRSLKHIGDEIYSITVKFCILLGPVTLNSLQMSDMETFPLFWWSVKNI